MFFFSCKKTIGLQKLLLKVHLVLVYYLGLSILGGQFLLNEIGITIFVFKLNRIES